MEQHIASKACHLIKQTFCILQCFTEPLALIIIQHFNQLCKYTSSNVSCHPWSPKNIKESWMRFCDACILSNAKITSPVMTTYIKQNPHQMHMNKKLYAGYQWVHYDRLPCMQWGRTHIREICMSRYQGCISYAAGWWEQDTHGQGILNWWNGIKTALSSR